MEGRGACFRDRNNPAQESQEERFPFAIPSRAMLLGDFILPRVCVNMIDRLLPTGSCSNFMQTQSCGVYILPTIYMERFGRIVYL